MTRILFVCHGNICRSPMAEFVLKDMAGRADLAEELIIESAATSAEELGNPVYPPAAEELARHGIGCAGKRARRLCQEDCERYDLIIGMDEENMRYMRRLFGAAANGKLHTMLEYAGRPGEAVADPWYTRDFERTWLDIDSGCRGLIEALSRVPVTIDLSACRTREQLYALIGERLHFAGWYGSNLDALYDALTGLPHKGERFELILPPEDTELYAYALRVQEVFGEAGALNKESMQR